MEEDIKTIAVADPSKQESLVTEAEVDPMDGEQTWPTDEELKQAEGWEGCLICRFKHRTKTGGIHSTQFVFIPGHIPF